MVRLGQSMLGNTSFKRKIGKKKFAYLLEKSEKKNQGSGSWVGLGQSMLRIRGNCQTFDKLTIFP